MRKSDETLVFEAQGGDRTAFEELVRCIFQLVFARLYLEVGDTHRSEDLLQETLLWAYRSLGQLNDPKNLRTWLLTIAQNVLMDDARRRARLKRAEPPPANSAILANLPGRATPPEEEAARSELREQVLEVLRSLPQEYQLPLTLRFIVGADYQTIETQLGLTNGSLRGVLHRGLKLLRARLGELDERGALAP